MKKLDFKKMEKIVAGSESGNGCIYRGMATPVMIIFSGFISSSYLDSWWNYTVDNCF